MKELIPSLIIPIIKDFFVPKLQKAIANYHIEQNQLKNIEDNIGEYLVQRYEKFQVIDTLVFPNKQTLFNTLYEPLTITTTEPNHEKVTLKIEHSPQDFMTQFIRILIEDSAGMGKSTITKKLFKSIIDAKVSIPILIELRHLNNNNKILQELQKQLSPLGNQISHSLLLKIIQQGQFTFLFDGFDEIAISEKESVIRDLHDFLQKATNNYFFITSRPENSLTSFGDFKKFTIEPLSNNEAYSLISRYDTYSYKSIKDKLIAELSDTKDEAIIEFLKNPLLVSLLYKSFDYKKDIPVKKCQFYRQVYDALFESHDLSKEGYFKREKYSQLHIDDFERVLRHIGYFTLITNEVEYEINQILEILERIKRYLPDLTFKASDFLKDVLETVPLFKKEGHYVKWSHKSLQDYFAAKFIWMDAKENQEKILKKIYKAPDIKRFSNVLELFYELDIKTFESTILYWLLTDFSNYAETHRDLFPDIPLIEKKRRIENCFHKNCYVVVAKEGDINKFRKPEVSNDVLTYYRSKYFTPNVDLVNTELYHYINDKILAITFISDRENIELLLKIISHKEPKLATYKVHEHDQHRLTFLPNQEQRYSVNYSTENKLNEKEFFSVTNDLTVYGHTIHYDYALEKLKTIKESISNSAQDELLNW